MMKELADDRGTNFVFSTATQPAFEPPPNKNDLRWQPGTLTEIVRDPGPLHAALKRAEICWEIERPVGWPELAARMVAVSQCLAIVNVRDHASQLYEEVFRVASEKGFSATRIFHLPRACARRIACGCWTKSATDCRRGNRAVWSRPNWLRPVLDVDFPLVLRALAPLDSIVQAAGRADPEGKRTAKLGRPGGEVVFFLPEESQDASK